jgi:hypothetical protein
MELCLINCVRECKNLRGETGVSPVLRLEIVPLLVEL